MKSKHSIIKLSMPAYQLKSKAKKLKKEQGLTMTEALNQVAKAEGYSSWSLLYSKAKEIYPQSREEILDYLNPGDLMLIGSRPGLGKTTFTLQILAQARQEKIKSYFFSLEYTLKDVAEKMASINESIGMQNEFLKFDFSDEICADYIIQVTKDDLPKGSIIAIDYLQLLDQDRSKANLQEQVLQLKQYAKEMGCILLFISQLDRSFESKGVERPGLDDVRLPNPLDLNLFNKTMFLHNGKKVFTSPHHFEID